MSNPQERRSSSPASDGSTPPVRRTTDYLADYGNLFLYNIDNERSSSTSYAADALLEAVNTTASDAADTTAAATPANNNTTGNDTSQDTDTKHSKSSTAVSRDGALGARRSSRLSAPQQDTQPHSTMTTGTGSNANDNVEQDGDVIMSNNTSAQTANDQQAASGPRPKLVLKLSRLPSNRSQASGSGQMGSSVPSAVVAGSGTAITTSGIANTSPAPPTASTNAASSQQPPLQVSQPANTSTSGRGNRNPTAHNTTAWTWQEEEQVLLMNPWQSRAALHTQHNAWLAANGYAHQRQPNAVWQRIGGMRADGITPAVLRNAQMS